MRYLVLLVLCGVILSVRNTYSSVLSTSQLHVFRQHKVHITSHDSNHWEFKHNGIPDHAYGPFPSNHNPNSVTPQNNDWLIPKLPIHVNKPMCLPMGPIGVAVSGIPFFNPYSAEGYNAVGGVDGTGKCAEVFDSCKGHPQMNGIYHYHQLPHCLYNGTENQFLGVALDGNPIYGPKIEGGKIVSRKSGILDQCGGRMYHGHYRYHITYDFPYILGCYKNQVHIRHHPNHFRRSTHISQIHKRQFHPWEHDPWNHQNNPHHGCQRPTGGPNTWLPCYAKCENPILGCNTTSPIIG